MGHLGGGYSWSRWIAGTEERLEKGKERFKKQKWGMVIEVTIENMLPAFMTSLGPHDTH